MKRVLVVATLLLGCTRKEPAHQVESAAPRSAEPVAAAEASDGATQGSVKSPLPLTLQVEKSAGGVGVHVLQRGPETVELAAAVAIERVGAPAERVAQALTLRSACKQDGCLKLAPGGELVAPVWLGQVEGERCDALFVPASAGEHVLTVKSCDGARSAEVHFFWNGR